VKRLLLAIQAAYSDASTWLPAAGAVLVALAVGIPALWRKFHKTHQRVALILIACGITTLAIIHNLPPRHEHVLGFLVDGNCLVTPGSEDDHHVVSLGGNCTIIEITRQGRTSFVDASYGITYDIHRRLSTPGTGFALHIRREDGTLEVRSLLVRHRGFQVGKNWSLELWEQATDPSTRRLGRRRLNPDTYWNLGERPDRVQMKLAYDGMQLTLTTAFISDEGSKSYFIGAEKSEVFAVQIPGIEKILTSITSVGQDTGDQRPFDASISSYWWQDIEKDSVPK
jgi:hypothetical protein